MEGKTPLPHGIPGKAPKERRGRGSEGRGRPCETPGGKEEGPEPEWPLLATRLGRGQGHRVNPPGEACFLAASANKNMRSDGKCHGKGRARQLHLSIYY